MSSIMCAAPARFGSQLFAAGGIGDVAELNRSGGGQREDEAGERDALVFLILHRRNASISRDAHC